MPHYRPSKFRHASSSHPTNDEFEVSLAQLEQELNNLKLIYYQLKQTGQLWNEPDQNVQNVEKQFFTPELVAQLEISKQKLWELAIDLTSRLSPYDGFGDIFWQTIRLTGLGIVIGWCLKSCTG